VSELTSQAVGTQIIADLRDLHERSGQVKALNGICLWAPLS
jgi:hypothetical protein